jgi:hypothetical protein
MASPVISIRNQYVQMISNSNCEAILISVYYPDMTLVLLEDDYDKFAL